MARYLIACTKCSCTFSSEDRRDIVCPSCKVKEQMVALKKGN
jgi:Zn finger protein HypA/HybF involved in hydrogenase expression